MMICSNCKESFSNDFVFCPLCGNKLKNQVVCQKCKKVLDDSYQFCPYCGTSITIQTKEESSSDNNGAADKIDSKGNSKEYKDSLKLEQLKIQAEKGIADAQYELGKMYDDGKGVPVDKEEALKWYMKSAEQGNNDAQYHLGTMYFWGEGVTEDKEEAFKWYMKSAEQGDDDAQFAVGFMYLNGDGVEVNRYEAFEWYKKAVEKGNSLAEDDLKTEFDITDISNEKEIEKVQGDLLFELAEKYFNRDGIKKDINKASEYYRKAVEHGNEAARTVLENEINPLLNIEKLKEKENNGDIEAQVKLAGMYNDGEIYDANSNAFKWYMKAAEQGDSKAQFEIGEMYFYGYSGDSTDIEEDIEEALKWYTKAAEQGNVDAQNRLGDIYYYGDCVEEDGEKAFKWHMKAAEQGDPDALYSIASYYDLGVYVEKNEYEAFEWYKKAADAGCDYAEDKLKDDYGITKYSSETEINKVRGDLLNEEGNRYHNGTEVDRDYHKATEFYHRAANLGNMDAQFNLALAYENGSGVEKNASTAAAFYYAAAKQGLLEAQFNLGFMYENGNGVDKSLEEAFKWYRKAAEQGSDRAQAKVSWCYFYGKGVVKSYDLAAYWCAQAAKQNNTNSQKNLGVMYEHGYGVPQDLKEAAVWFRKAAEQGNEEAAICLANVETKLNRNNKSKNYPHIKLSEISKNIIGLAANNVFNDSMWQSFGFKKAPLRGAVFNYFINSDQLTKEIFFSREFLIVSLGIFVGLLHKRTDFSDDEYIKYLSNYVLDFKDVPASLRFNSIYEAKKYFESYIKEYAQEDNNLEDVFLKHCRYNNVATDASMVTGAYSVCDSLSSFLEQKIEEIDSNYYIEDDITSFGINKTKPVYHATIPQPVQQPLVEDSLGKKRELSNETTMNQKYYLLRHIYNDGRGKKQMIFNNKDQAEAFFRQVVYGDHSRHSQITLFECSDEGVIMLDGRRFRS